MSYRATLAFVASVLCASAWPGGARALELITNGGFETGDLTGWTATDLAGGSGSFFVDDADGFTPFSGNATFGPAAGSFYAVSDQTGPGTHVLSQAFTVPAGATSVTLRFDLFANDWSNAGPLDQGLDHTLVPNQHARVDVMDAGAGAFDTGAGVLSNLFLGVDLGVDPSAPTPYVFDITSVVAGGGTFVLRFGQVDNQSFFNLGVDKVSIDAIVCGNSTVDPGEQCDDGNLFDGDCCSSTCQYEASGSPCSDADACNGGETCDGAGVCLGGTPLDCDDGDLCTQDSCDPDSGCVNAEEPAPLCRTAGSSQLLFKQKGGAKDKLVWKWIKGEATSQQDFADPTGGAAYSLCIYAGPANALVAQADVPTGGSWKPLSNKGYKYFDAGLGAGGIQKVLLKGGTAGKAKALVKGKGGGLPDPMLGLALPVTAQLVKGGATPLCVGSTYGTAIKNETGQFKAKQQP